MSGKRQHFIPQFLQKGFASHFHGDEIFTWVYKKDVAPFNPNIKNVGVESYFYSENNDSTLDDAITIVENDYAQLIDKIRNDNNIIKRHIKIIAQLIGHLEVRTRHIRQNFFTTGNRVLNELLEFLDTPASCEVFLRQMIKNYPTLIRDAFSEGLRERGLPQAALPILMKLSKPFIEIAMPNMSHLLPNMASYLKSEIPAILKQASKTGHIKALNRGLAPDMKVNLFDKLNYRIINTENDFLILGDSALLFHVSGDRAFKPFLEKGDDLIAVFLPITYKQVLVGSKGKYVPDFSTLRQMIAFCSLEYFIAHEANSENERLHKGISKNAHLLSKSEIEKIVSDLINVKPSNHADSADSEDPHC